MDEPEGLQAAARGFKFRESAAFLLDEVVLGPARAFGRFENVFPLCRAFPEQNGVAFRLFRRPVFEMERPDSARICANPRHWIGACLQGRAHIQLEHDRWLRILREFQSDADFRQEQILSGDCDTRLSNQPIPTDRRQRLANPRWPSSHPAPVSVPMKPSPHTCFPESGSSRAPGRFSPDSGTNYHCALKNTAYRDRPAVFAFAWSDSRTTRNRARRILRLDIPFVRRRAPCPRDLSSIPRGRNRARVPLELISPCEPRKPTAALKKKRETLD